jgi:chromosome segregation ATPase
LLKQIEDFKKQVAQL